LLLCFFVTRYAKEKRKDISLQKKQTGKLFFEDILIDLTLKKNMPYWPEARISYTSLLELFEGQASLPLGIDKSDSEFSSKTKLYAKERFMNLVKQTLQAI